ncbi:MAG: hypothetical protein ACI87J_001843 [Colwellia sp.]|jgi:hypothetical protein
MIIKLTSNEKGTNMENRTARLTVLIDPQKKAIFDKLCALDDVNASQKVRQMIREYIEDRLGEDWQDDVFK